MTQKYFFESKNSDNYLELFKDNNNSVWVDKMHIDSSKYDFILEFCTMINNAFQSAKDKGAINHHQYVSIDDWDEYLKNDDRWDIVKECENNIYLIMCDIDDAPKCIIDAFLKNEEYDFQK
jgi:hypothetical protein